MHNSTSSTTLVFDVDNSKTDLFMEKNPHASNGRPNFSKGAAARRRKCCALRARKNSYPSWVKNVGSNLRPGPISSQKKLWNRTKTLKTATNKSYRYLLSHMYVACLLYALKKLNLKLDLPQ